MKICRELDGIGIEVAFATTVGDDEKAIAGCIAAAIERTDAVIITGGLGPTHDDLTREALAAAIGSELEHHPELEDELRRFFESRARTMNELNLIQAYLPGGAEAIPNTIGTAPGISVEHAGVPIFALPGVPAEMENMLRHHVLPALLCRWEGKVNSSKVLRAVGRGESDVAGMITPIVDACKQAGEPSVTILASRGEVAIHLRASGPDREAGLAKIEPVEAELRKALGRLVYGQDDSTLQSVVSSMAHERGLTLAVVESFTGGALASRIVAVPGASSVLRAGYVTYAIEAKVQEVGVPQETLDRYGAVSEQTAREMAEGGRERSGADIGLSTTGEAGPNPEEEPVGTMFIGLAWDGGSIARKFIAAGNREDIREWGSRAALDTFRRWMLDEASV
ncbi:MAG TPA: CinA family nicotinamide mononucleotide deamidase-related protein, partial [Actinomycetota bacterium]|nr:CinA family nicotinamide mononucleotide deamidase-related protein [Actinomycetota bacterium]